MQGIYVLGAYEICSLTYPRRFSGTSGGKQGSANMGSEQGLRVAAFCLTRVEDLHDTAGGALPA